MKRMVVNDFQPGQKVTYNGHKPEIGIVKSVSNSAVFVVFNCGGDWDNYQNYTASSCLPSKLSDGWVIENENFNFTDPYDIGFSPPY